MNTTLPQATRRVYDDGAQSKAYPSPEWVGVIFFGVIAAIFACGEMAISHWATTTSLPGTIGMIMALMAVAVCAFKVGWMPAAEKFRRNGQFGVARATKAFGILAHTFSFVAIFGCIATSREDMVQIRASAQSKEGLTKEEYRLAEADVEKYRGVRPAAAVEAEKSRIEASIADAERRAAAAADVEKAHASKACGVLCNQAAKEKETALAEKASLQKKLATVEAELFVSLDAAKADRRLSAARTAMQNAPAAVKNADPQAQSFVDLFGSFSVEVSQKNVAIWMLLLLALVCEFGTPLSANAAVNFYLGKPAQIIEARSVNVARAERIEPTLYDVRPASVQAIVAQSQTETVVDAVQIAAQPVSMKDRCLKALIRAIAQDPSGEVRTDCRKLAVGFSAHVLDENESISKTTVAQYLADWHNAGQIAAFKKPEDGRTYATLSPERLREARAAELEYAALPAA